MMAILIIFIVLRPSNFIGQLVFQKTACQVKGRIRTVTTRKYEQRLRAEAAAETKRRILDAVYERLRAAPAEPVSVDKVAKMAGVARSTVYLIFGSRAGLFDALSADLMQRSGFGDIVMALHNPDPQASLRESIGAAVTMFAAHRDVLRVLHSMSQLDSDAVGGAIERAEPGHETGMRTHATRLAEQGLLRPDISVDDAVHLLWTLTGFDTFDLLYHGRGLPVEKVTELVVTMAERSLYVDP
jgi:AcrR family transcriptional regulator